LVADLRDDVRLPIAVEETMGAGDMPPGTDSANIRESGIGLSLLR
jgi:hypothetical protein